MRIAPSASAYERLGWSRFRLGEFEQSITAYRRSLQLTPTYWPALNGIGANGLYRWQQGNREDPGLARMAREAYRQSLRINPWQQDVVDILFDSGL